MAHQRRRHQRRVGGSEGRAASRLGARRDKLVAVEGTTRGCQVTPRRPEGEIIGVLVVHTEVESVSLSGVQMPGDHFVGVERQARPTRFYPPSQSLVEIRPVRLQ